MLIIDGMGREIEFKKTPERVISLIPCVTESLFELGASDKIVGITEYCIYPADKVKDIQKVGGPKSPNIDFIDKINPDLIFMDPDENRLEDFEVLQKNYPIFIAKGRNIEDSIAFIQKIGDIWGTKSKADELVKSIRDYLNELHLQNENSHPKKVLVLLWKKPYFVPSNNTYINSLIESYGLKNVFSDRVGYFEITEEQLVESQPDIILLPDEPYLFTKEDESDLKVLFDQRNIPIKIKIIIGTELCWYGVRTLKGLKYISEIVSQAFDN
jgi:ABC-type Fe3+-hydroxamate transport system substrate-binding protein